MLLRSLKGLKTQTELKRKETDERQKERKTGTKQDEGEGGKKPNRQVKIQREGGRRGEEQGRGKGEQWKIKVWRRI